ncbi:MAG: hypothetical protein AB7H96_24700 [Vicinamibacterales bacterium]
MGVLPHSAQLKSDVADYLSDAAAIAADLCGDLAKSDSFRAIFKITLATSVVLNELSVSETPKLTAASGIARKIPVLICFGQTVAASTELRRLIEVSAWTLYFTDHPREWAERVKSPRHAFERDTLRPLAFAAHRELSYYLNYAAEVMTLEPSGLAANAIEDLKTQHGNLSGDVHPGETAVAGAPAPPVDDMSPGTLSRFMERQRAICAAIAIAESAMFVSRFNALSPAGRGWFDWLVGKDRAKQLRSGPFGL